MTEKLKKMIKSNPAVIAGALFTVFLMVALLLQGGFQSETQTVNTPTGEASQQNSEPSFAIPIAIVCGLIGLLTFAGALLAKGNNAGMALLLIVAAIFLWQGSSFIDERINNTLDPSPELKHNSDQRESNTDRVYPLVKTATLATGEWETLRGLRPGWGICPRTVSPISGDIPKHGVWDFEWNVEGPNTVRITNRTSGPPRKVEFRTRPTGSKCPWEA